MIVCKSNEEIKIMSRAGKIVARVLERIEEVLKAGITTKYLDDIAEEFILREGAIPAFKGYVGRISSVPFPSSICVSINEEVVHGIPGKRIVREGDLVSVDVGVKLDGFYADATRSFIVGKTTDLVVRLHKATYEALELAIEKCVVGNRLSDISHEIERRAIADGFSVVRDFVGHGIGRNMHEEPQILNYGPPGQGPVLKSGMVFAIEPMLNEGGSEVEILDNMWTVVTKDRKLSCHFEDTVVITREGPLILTRLD